MTRPRGGYIGFNRVPSASALNSAASGIWTLREAESLKRAGTWPLAEGWSPVSLSGLRCWLDASDTTTLLDAASGGSLPADGGGIALWTDKSGSNNAEDAVDGSNQRLSTYRPVRVASAQNGLDAIGFTRPQFFDHNSARDMLRNRSCAIMAVAMKFGAVSNGLNGFAWTNRELTSPNVTRFQLVHLNNDTFTVTSARLDEDASVNINTSAAPPYNTDWHVHVALLNWNAGTMAYRIDGTQIGTASYASSGNTSDTSLGTRNVENGATFTAIGHAGRAQRTDATGDTTNSLFTGSRIGEMICWALGSGSYTTSDLQTAEAYLAWKWGLQANLPADHPYKNASP